MHVEMRPQVNERETYSPPPSGEGSLLSGEASQHDTVTKVTRSSARSGACRSCSWRLRAVSRCTLACTSLAVLGSDLRSSSSSSSAGRTGHSALSAGVRG